MRFDSFTVGVKCLGCQMCLASFSELVGASAPSEVLIGSYLQKFKKVCLCNCLRTIGLFDSVRRKIVVCCVYEESVSMSVCFCFLIAIDL